MTTEVEFGLDLISSYSPTRGAWTTRKSTGSTPVRDTVRVGSTMAVREIVYLDGGRSSRPASLESEVNHD